MIFFALFTALSALFIQAVATPLPAYRPRDSNYRSTLYRRAPPKFEIPPGLVSRGDKNRVLDKMTEHYNTRATDAQKRAGLASANSRWKTHLPGQEFMKFNYHEGDTTDSPIIHPPARIYRDKPIAKMRFLNVLTEHHKEMRAESVKRYNNLCQDEADNVKSMQVWGSWDVNGGIREKTKLTFHSTTRPKPEDTIGHPMTIYRPLTLQIPDVPPSDRITIDSGVREAHAKMVEGRHIHLARTSNFGTVHSNWHDSLPDAKGKTHKQVVVGLEEVSEDEERRKHLGNYAVRKGKRGSYELVGLNTGNPSSQTGPSDLNNEVAHPSNSQERLDVGSSSTHALSYNPGSSHLDSQGSSQVTAGSLSSHPRPSCPELLQPVSSERLLQPHAHTGSPPLYPVSSQQPLQSQAHAHTGSLPLHNEIYMPSPGPLSQPSHDSSHPSDQLHSGSPHIPPNSPIQPHPNSPPSHPHPELAQSSSALLPSQPAPLAQVGPSPNAGGSPASEHDELSPEIWHLLNPEPVYPYPWNPHQQNP